MSFQDCTNDKKLRRGKKEKRKKKREREEEEEEEEGFTSSTSLQTPRCLEVAVLVGKKDGKLKLVNKSYTIN